MTPAKKNEPEIQKFENEVILNDFNQKDLFFNIFIQKIGEFFKKNKKIP